MDAQASEAMEESQTEETMTQPDYDQMAREFIHGSDWQQSDTPEDDVIVIARKFREIAENARAVNCVDQPDDLNRVIGEKPRNCPTCDSPNPKLHPAMQFEGEVQPCEDKWHSKPQTEWKVGQMVIHSGSDHIYRLRRRVPEGWEFDYWLETEWRVGSEYGIFTDGYVPYPRAWDWVRCVKASHAHIINPFQTKAGQYPDCDFEPASPPVEQCAHGKPIGTCSHPKCEVEQPKPTLEGEHWDDVVSGKMLTFKGGQINKCLLNLRDEFRRLVEAMKETNAR